MTCNHVFSVPLPHTAGCSGYRLFDIFIDMFFGSCFCLSSCFHPLFFFLFSLLSFLLYSPQLHYSSGTSVSFVNLLAAVLPHPRLVSFLPGYLAAATWRQLSPSHFPLLLLRPRYLHRTSLLFVYFKARIACLSSHLCGLAAKASVSYLVCVHPEKSPLLLKTTRCSGVFLYAYELKFPPGYN